LLKAFTPEHQIYSFFIFFTVVWLKTHFVPKGLLASLYHAYYQYFVRRVADSPPKEGRNIGRIKATPESAKSATGGRDILSVLEHSKCFYRTVMIFYKRFFQQK
jgi:hypothetical protein